MNNIYTINIRNLIDFRFFNDGILTFYVNEFLKTINFYLILIA
jgi:hypothetical protein